MQIHSESTRKQTWAEWLQQAISILLPDTPRVRVRKPPLAVSITAGLLVIALILQLGLLAFVQHDWPDPFAAYGDLLAGNPLSAAIARGFFCSGLRGDPSSAGTCYTALVSELFSDVTVRAGKGYETTFRVRNNALVAGELMLEWGTPTIKFCDQIAVLTWPKGKSAKVFVPKGQHFNSLVPVWLVSFADGTMPSWMQVIARPECALV